MSERDVESLAALVHEDAVFVHMGGTMSKAEELDVIRSGAIQYKTVDIQETSVRLIGTTAILLNRIRLVAVVGGNEVTNPFVVTEVLRAAKRYVEVGLALVHPVTDPVAIWTGGKQPTTCPQGAMWLRSQAAVTS